MNELIDLTLDGETFDSFPDQTARAAIKELKEEIPTDDSINDLINAALGVIENGTY